MRRPSSPSAPSDTTVMRPPCGPARTMHLSIFSARPLWLAVVSMGDRMRADETEKAGLDKFRRVVQFQRDVIDARHRSEARARLDRALIHLNRSTG